MPPSSARVSCVLDTDIVIDFLRQQPYALELIRDLSAKGVAAVSTVTHLEVVQAVKPGEEEGTRTFLDGLMSLAVTLQIARIAGNIQKLLRDQGKNVSVTDAIIAATAIHLDVPLITNNVENYSFPGLRVHKGR